ncbi:NF038122 family metalloprotease [Bradyrhizobium guangdongense]
MQSRYGEPEVETKTMRSRSTQEDLLSDDPFYTVAGNNIQGSYIPAASGGTSTGGSTSGSVMSVSSGGITINLVLDAAAQAAPTSFKNGLQQAIAILAANITDKITVNIKIDYSGTGGGAAAGPDSGSYENYSWVRSELINNASAGDATFNSLPIGSTIQGQTNVAVWNAQLKLWGAIGANDTTTDDASANFSTDINSNLLVGVALHELTHALGRVPYGSAPDVFDFYRFTSPGVRLFSGAQTAPAAYFSLDGGNTKLADYGQSSDPSDFLNSGVQGPTDPFNEYYTSGTSQALSSVDKAQLNALGFHLSAPASGPPVVVASNLQETSNWSPVPLSTHFAYRDPANLPAATWRIQDVSSDGSNALLLNGTPLSASSPVNLTPAQFNQITISSVSSSHDIWAVASDGTYWSSPVHFTVYPFASAAVGPPVVVASNLQETLNWSPVPLSTHFAYSDPANLPVETWRIQDVSSDGSNALLLNGSPLSASSPVNLTPAQFNQITISSVTSSHDIWAVANDGTYWSSPVHFTVSPFAPAAVGPPVLVASNLQETSNWSPVPLSTHFAYSDPANLPAATWRIQDVSSDGSNALLLNGSPLSASSPVNLTPAQFNQITISSVSSSHDIWAVANDGTYWSSPVHFTVSPFAPAAVGPPVLVASNLQETSNWSPVPVSTHFAYSDPANLPAATWRIQDVSSDGSNALLLSGTPLSAPSPVNLTPAQFAQVTIGSVNSSHDIWAVANDGSFWSAPVHFSVSPPAPTVFLDAAHTSPQDFASQLMHHLSDFHLL